MNNHTIIHFDKEKYLNESIEILELNVRLYKILKNNHIHTLRDLISRNVKDIVTLPGIGPVLRNELSEVYSEIKSETEPNRIGRCFFTPRVMIFPSFL
ncbi:DNA-directed RNA polymerase subunit alpha C-terminal domain-containing protein [Sporosarcina psychrophila]|uniref:DNA-directed RNA polymerase alpha subunit n=1 Tax=Sporosarcina psychrophila TaxID=1476 RepID=A0ABV2KDA3_SPOPS